MFAAGQMILCSAAAWARARCRPGTWQEPNHYWINDCWYGWLIRKRVERGGRECFVSPHYTLSTVLGMLLMWRHFISERW